MLRLQQKYGIGLILPGPFFYVYGGFKSLCSLLLRY